ncbi:hypothetical protein JW851_01680 [Candidatus Woesearchaeota archaeon]|nr:hypothetical protein [Candidatus Woesearchaeota archaeon]
MNKPEKKFRAGPISAAIWKNKSQKDGKDVEFHTITIGRCYRDKEGNWKNSASLRISDLPKASLVLDKAYEHLIITNNDFNVTEEALEV